MTDPSETELLQEEVKKTQTLLSQHIKHPPLASKTLMKPPFRFIRDIVVNVIKETGYLRGIFTKEEIDPDRTLTVEQKRLFLNKLIIAAMETTSLSTEVRPSKILSGKEPLKTNELLQMIANGAALVKDIDKGRGRLKVGLDEKVKEKFVPKRFVIEEGKGKKGKGEVRGGAGKKVNEVGVVGKGRKGKEVAQGIKGSCKGKTGEIDKSPLVSKENIAEPATPLKVEEAESNNKAPLDNNVESESENTCNNLYLELCTRKSVIHSPKESDDSQLIPLENKASEISLCKSDTSVPLTDEESLAKPNPNVSEIPQLLEQEEKPIPPKSRPTTARRPPPSRGSFHPMVFNRTDDSYRPPEGKVTNVLLDTLNDEEDDTFLASEANPLDAIQSVPETTPHLLPLLPEQRGHLVNQIIKTQQELEEACKSERLSNLLEKEKQRLRESHLSEINHLTGLIQLSAKNANPISKLLDYVAEDVHLIESDIRKSREEKSRISLEIDQHRINGETTLDPYQKKIKETEWSIKEKEEEITRSNMKILELQKKIGNILRGINRFVPSSGSRGIQEILPSAEEIGAIINDCGGGSGQWGHGGGGEGQ